MGQDQDDAVIVPYTTVQKRLLGVTHIQNITISAEPGVPLDALSVRIVETLRARHAIGAGDDDDFMVRTLEEMASVLTSTTTTMRWLLASVAAVSLLVGGIGIMNTMLVSVLRHAFESNRLLRQLARSGGVRDQLGGGVRRPSHAPRDSCRDLPCAHHPAAVAGSSPPGCVGIPAARSGSPAEVAVGGRAPPARPLLSS